MTDTTVFRARNIVTMDRNRPSATHVAVREGRILAVGDADCAGPWGGGRADNRFADAVLLPGFVEGHAHMMAGAMWNFAYAGYHDRVDPDGRIWRGKTDLDTVIADLKAYADGLEPGEPLFGWGFDPIFLPTERLSRRHLDAIDPDRPIAIMFSSFHVMTVNSAALALAGYDRHSNIEGIVRDADGEPTGELQEMGVMFPVLDRLGVDFRALSQTEPAIRAYGKVANRAGVTTIADLYSMMSDDDVALMTRVAGAADFPVRIVPALAAMGDTPDNIAARALALRKQSTDRLRLGSVKLMTDGSIQGWTARVKWPGYVEGQPNGLWNTAPAEIGALALAMQKAGVQMNIHTNGDEASEVAIAAIEAAARAHPWPGHRHVLQHCQMMGADQFRRCAELGIATNIFANHIWYFGDQHVARTIGPDRAARMDAVRDALDAGVNVAIHSDAPVTPLGPLFTAWCAVNRQTMSGKTLGPAQRITVAEALHAITLGAAFTMKLDAEIGSIEAGKRADFAVLAEDPTVVDPMAIKDIAVLGTVMGGTVHQL